MPACPACRAAVVLGARRCATCDARLGWPPGVVLLPEEARPAHEAGTRPAPPGVRDHRVGIPVGPISEQAVDDGVDDFPSTIEGWYRAGSRTPVTPASDLGSRPAPVGVGGPGPSPPGVAPGWTVPTPPPDPTAFGTYPAGPASSYGYPDPSEFDVARGDRRRVWWAAAAVLAVVVVAGVGFAVSRLGAESTGDLAAYLDGTDAVTFRDASSRFEVLLPAEPSVTQEGGVDGDGPWVVDLFETRTSGVTTRVRAFDAVASGLTVEQQEELLRENASASARTAAGELVAAERVADEPVTLDYAIASPEGTLFGRALMVGERVYQLEVQALEDAEGVQTFRRMTESFRILPG